MAFIKDLMVYQFNYVDTKSTALDFEILFFSDDTDARPAYGEILMQYQRLSKFHPGPISYFQQLSQTAQAVLKSLRQTICQFCALKVRDKELEAKVAITKIILMEIAISNQMIRKYSAMPTLNWISYNNSIVIRKYKKLSSCIEIIRLYYH